MSQIVLTGAILGRMGSIRILALEILDLCFHAKSSLSAQVEERSGEGQLHPSGKKRSMKMQARH